MQLNQPLELIGLRMQVGRGSVILLEVLLLRCGVRYVLQLTLCTATNPM